MKIHFKTVSIFLVFIFIIISCAKAQNTHEAEGSMDNLPNGIYFKEASISVFKGVEKIDSKQNQKNNAFLNSLFSADNTYNQMKINMKCFEVYPNGTEFSQNEIIITSITNTFDLIKDKTCQISLKEITISGRIYSPTNGSLLTLGISPSLLSPVTDPLLYVSPDNGQYYIAANADGARINIQYASSKQEAANIPTNKIVANPVSVAVAEVPLPQVNNLSLFYLDKINFTNASVTLYGSASNFTSCKIILKDSIPSVSSADWKKIDSLYKSSIVDNKSIFDCTNFQFGKADNFLPYKNNNWILIYENHLPNGLLSSYLYLEINAKDNNNYTFYIDKSFSNNGFFNKSQLNSNLFCSRITLSSNNEPIISGLYSNASNIYGFDFGKIDPNNPLPSSIKNDKELGFPDPINMSYLFDHITFADNSSIIGYTDGGTTLNLTKFKANGQLDSSFGTQGKLTYVANGSNIWSVKMHSQLDNTFILQLFISVRTSANSYTSGYYVKFLGNGTLDNSFGTAGVVSNVIPTDTIRLVDFIILKNNSFVDISYNDKQYMISKYKANGMKDASFANLGTYIENLTAPVANALFGGSFLAEGINGSIIYALNINSYHTISSLTNSGQVDSNYNSNVKKSFKPPQTRTMLLTSIKAKEDGTLYGIGYRENNKTNGVNLYFIKLKPDGTYDGLFAENGIYTESNNSNNYWGYDFALTTDNKIYSCATDWDSKQIIVSRYIL